MLGYLSSTNFTKIDVLLYIADMTFNYHHHCVKEDMYTVSSNLKQLVRELSAKVGEDYDLTKVADMSGLSRFTVSSIANNRNARVDYSTLAKLLEFFHKQGLKITLADLFVVES